MGLRVGTGRQAIAGVAGPNGGDHRRRRSGTAGAPSPPPGGPSTARHLLPDGSRVCARAGHAREPDCRVGGGRSADFGCGRTGAPPSPPPLPLPHQRVPATPPPLLPDGPLVSPRAGQGRGAVAEVGEGRQDEVSSRQPGNKQNVRFSIHHTVRVVPRSPYFMPGRRFWSTEFTLQYTSRKYHQLSLAGFHSDGPFALFCTVFRTCSIFPILRSFPVCFPSSSA